MNLEDLIQLAWHVLTGPTSPGQSVVAVRALSTTTTEAINRKNLNEWRLEQQPRSRQLFCDRSYHSVPRLWRLKRNNGGRKPNFATGSIRQVPPQRGEATETQRINQAFDDSCLAVAVPCVTLLGFLLSPRKG